MVIPRPDPIVGFMRSRASLPMLLVAAVFAFGLTLWRPTAARAQPSEVAVQPAAAERPRLDAPPPDDEVRRLDERTALTLGAHKLKLGVLAFDYGITDWLN